MSTVYIPKASNFASELGFSAPVNTPSPPKFVLPKVMTSDRPFARAVLATDLQGMEAPPNGEVRYYFRLGFVEEAGARGWPKYPDVQRVEALRVGTLVAWAHGWRIDGYHELHLEHEVPESRERPIKIEPRTRLTVALGGRPVYLDLGDQA